MYTFFVHFCNKAVKDEEEWTVYGSLCTVADILLKKLPPKWVVVIFAVVMAAAGVKMLFF